MGRAGRVRAADLIRLAAILVAAAVVPAGCMVDSDDASESGSPPGPPRALELTDVAQAVGLDFRQGAFRWEVTPDPAAMLGGGVCWLDYDDDGWLDLYVVNSWAEEERARWVDEEGGLPRNALYRNVEGRFVDVSEASGADLAVRGNGCVAADLDRDGNTDLFVTTDA
ncbi:MAG TPA: VCBS repeat-containing protein, partial [Gaiellaceae bacterium]|nr:VCBS repeat-containing protein [Gaiellaceae bacterium]